VGHPPNHPVSAKLASISLHFATCLTSSGINCGFHDILSSMGHLFQHTPEHPHLTDVSPIHHTVHEPSRHQVAATVVTSAAAVAAAVAAAATVLVLLLLSQMHPTRASQARLA
jgi:hypothetical protein